MKKLILISALLLGSNVWADLKPLNEYPIEDFDDDTELAIEIGTRCVALFKWWGGIKNDSKYKLFEDSALLHSQTESQKYGEMWVQFLFPLLAKDSTQSAVIVLQKFLSSADPFVTEYSEAGTENYKKNGDYLEGGITGIDMDVCIGLMTDEPIIDDADYTTEDKAEAIADFFFFQNKTILDILVSQNGRDYHIKLRHVSFDVANQMVRSGELAGVYAELEKAMEKKFSATNSKYTQTLKEGILKGFTASEINAMYRDKPKRELRYAQDYINSDFTNGKYPRLEQLHAAIMDPELSSDESSSMDNLELSPYMGELVNVFADNEEYFEQVFDQALTEHGYPLEEFIDKEADILGIWAGVYGAHGKETINISKVDNQYIARKITGDVNVPAGEITFQFNTNFNDCKIQIAEIGFKNPDFLGCEIFRLNSSTISLEMVGGTMMHFTRTSTPRDGLHEKLYESGQLEERSHYKDYKLDGLYEHFYENGQLERKGILKDGEEEGIWEFFRENGQIDHKWTYREGVLHGIYEEFYENGQLQTRSNWTEGRKEGFYEAFYENGTLKSGGKLKNGKEEGVWHLFHENGRLDRKSNFKNGKAEGLGELFYESGQLQSRGNNKDGKKDGIWESFSDNGNLQERRNFKDGNLEGAEERFYDTGELYWKRNYKDGELDGRWESFFIEGKTSVLSNWKNGKELNQKRFLYYESGQLEGRSGFKGDQANGLYERFYENGQIKVRGNYQDGKQDSIWESFYGNGDLQQSVNYINGKQSGLVETFFNNGQLFSRENYKDGKGHGMWEIFYDNGQLELRENYKEGKQEGHSEMYYKNGQLQSRGSYKNGKRDGLWEEFDVDGNLIYSEEH